jgi:hypothetical protein
VQGSQGPISPILLGLRVGQFRRRWNQPAPGRKVRPALSQPRILFNF